MCPMITTRWRHWRAATAISNSPRRWQPDGSSQELHRIDGLLLELIEVALARRFVGPPAQDRGAVAKPLAAEMIVGHLDHEFRLQRTPARRTIGRPAARATRCIAGK